MLRKPTANTAIEGRIYSTLRSISWADDVRLLAAILVGAVILRIGAAVVLGNTVQPMPGIYDQVSYHSLAERVLEGHGFSFADDHWPATRAGEPTAHWSYLYTLYLAAVYAVTDVQPLLARLLQVVIVGVLHPWLVFRISSRVFDRRIGLLAAALTAVYVYFVYYSGALLTESFYIVGLLWTLDSALRIGERYRKLDDAKIGSHDWALWSQFGLAAGITVLLRQLFLLIVPFILMWIAWQALTSNVSDARKIRTDRIRQYLAGAILSLVILAALILPWTFRNYRSFDSFVPLNTNSGYAFFWGNHPVYGTQFQGILPADGPSYYDLIPPELLTLNEAELDKALLKQGIGFVVDEPGRYILLSLSRTREYFKFWPSPESSLVSNLSRVFSFGIMMPFMLYGLWLSSRLVRLKWGSVQASQILLLWMFAALYTAIHLLTWALIRYRLPVDAVLLIFAALAIADIVTRIGWASPVEARNE